MDKAKRATVAVSRETADALRSAAEGVGLGVGEFLRMAVTRPELIQRAAVEGLISDLETTRSRLVKRDRSRPPAPAAAGGGAPAAATDGGATQAAAVPAAPGSGPKAAAPAATAPGPKAGAPAASTGGGAATAGRRSA